MHGPGTLRESGSARVVSFGTLEPRAAPSAISQGSRANGRGERTSLPTVFSENVSYTLPPTLFFLLHSFTERSYTLTLSNESTHSTAELTLTMPRLNWPEVLGSPQNLRAYFVEPGWAIYAPPNGGAFCGPWPRHRDCELASVSSVCNLFSSQPALAAGLVPVITAILQFWKER
jgi:hypothetical protein